MCRACAVHGRCSEGQRAPVAPVIDKTFGAAPSFAPDQVAHELSNSVLCIDGTSADYSLYLIVFVVAHAVMIGLYAIPMSLAPTAPTKPPRGAASPVAIHSARSNRRIRFS